MDLDQCMKGLKMDFPEKDIKRLKKQIRNLLYEKIFCSWEERYDIWKAMGIKKLDNMEEYEKEKGKVLKYLSEDIFDIFVKIYFKEGRNE